MSQPPYLADAVARFRSVAAAAVDRGHRVADDALAAGAAFERAALEHQELDDSPDAEPTADEHRDAAAAYRTAHDLPIPDLTQAEDDRPQRRLLPEADDYSDFQVMYKL